MVLISDLDDFHVGVFLFLELFYIFQGYVFICVAQSELCLSKPWRMDVPFYFPQHADVLNGLLKVLVVDVVVGE